MLRPIRKVKKKGKNLFSVNLQNLLYTIFCESTVPGLQLDMRERIELVRVSYIWPYLIPIEILTNCFMYAGRSFNGIAFIALRNLMGITE